MSFATMRYQAAFIVLVILEQALSNNQTIAITTKLVASK
ncbi:hypothetical protein AALB_0127 [Agarivorans albus MKT 106]|uniref:Uncharacterized protein n=1 Tax=Agarivorans albus MKT 106 TaxID=1331007 RepID=R9PFC1_AGAAL|nr:hypothetical protein AALB_0127 [Agarivorans albus MKT 106]